MHTCGLFFTLMEPETDKETTLKAADATSKQNHARKKAEVCEVVIKRLKESRNEVVNSPGFCEELHTHFQRLPYKYALDVNVDSAEDVLIHKRLLQLAEEASKTEEAAKGEQEQSGQTRITIPAYHVRAVHVYPAMFDHSEPKSEAKIEDNPGGLSSARGSLPAPPSFGSSANLEALALEKLENDSSHGGHSAKSKSFILNVFDWFCHPMHQVTFSTKDKPKLLMKLSNVIADIGLNIREAHVFSTEDRYSLDVFVVDGWPTEDVEDLQKDLEKALKDSQSMFSTNHSPTASPIESVPQAKTPEVEFLRIPSDGNDWEIDPKLLKYNQKVASGSFGDLYRGTYCGQEVAIKVLKPERLNENLQKEFAQEVSIMRKVRHKNVVQFIGACTQPPNLCIVTEFMTGGSVYDHLHKKQGVFKLPTLLKVAIDVSKGMDYLHQCNIIHRDLKAANLLIDEHEVIKVADFGVARVQDHSGVMTAETGTYRWMAPEVIEHKPYNRKADVFSFGIVLWELMTGKLPYDHLTPLQAAVGVVQKSLRPTIPKNAHPKLAELLPRCWQQNPSERPDFSEITKILQDIQKEVFDEEKREKRGGFFSHFRNNLPHKPNHPSD